MNSEYCIIGILLNNPDVMEKYIKYGDIQKDKNVIKVYDIIKSQYDDHKSFTMQSVLDQAQQDQDFSITEFYKMYESEYDEAKLKIYINQIMIRNITNDMSRFKTELVSGVYKSYQDIKYKINDIADNMYLAGEHTIKKSDEICKAVLNNMTVTKVFSGDEFIESTNGGYDETDLIYLCGLASEGKTSRGISLIIKQLKDGMKVGFISAEMKAEKIMRIMASSISGVLLKKIETNTMDKKETLLFVSAMEWLYERDLYIDDESNDIEEVTSKIKIMKKLYKIDTVYVDYFQHLGSKNEKSAVEMYRNISRELKKSSKDLMIPHVVMAQLKATAENKDRPTIRDIEWCSKAGQDADIVILIKTVNYAIDGDYRDRSIEFIYGKNRNGSQGIDKYIFKCELRRFIKQREY